MVGALFHVLEVDLEFGVVAATVHAAVDIFGPRIGDLLHIEVDDLVGGLELVLGVRDAETTH
ncbi:hypothetical protein D9M69_655060 [compost metagenome]